MSVKNALETLGEQYVVTSDPSVILEADHVILPGVGEAGTAMNALKTSGLDKVIPLIKAPVLGICIGLQLLCRHSEEGDTECLGIFDEDVVRFRAEDSSQAEKVKIPHMGWNSISPSESPLFEGIPEGTFVYYIHSFAPETGIGTIATTTYGSRTFSAAISKDNFYGTQFHPEKSGAAGSHILQNFLTLCR